MIDRPLEWADHWKPTPRKRRSTSDVLRWVALAAACVLVVLIVSAISAFLFGPTADFQEPSTDGADEMTQAVAARIATGAGEVDRPSTFAVNGASVTLAEVVAPGYSTADAPAAARGVRAVLDFTVANDHEVSWWQDFSLHSWQPSTTVHVCRILTITPVTVSGPEDTRAVSVSTLDPDTAPKATDSLFSSVNWMSKEDRNEAWARDCSARSNDVDLNTGEQYNPGREAASLLISKQIGRSWSGVGQLQVSGLRDALRDSVSASWTAQERLRQALEATVSPAATGVQVASDGRYAAAVMMLPSRTCVTTWVGPDFDQVWGDDDPDRCDAKTALTTVPPSRPAHHG